MKEIDMAKNCSNYYPDGSNLCDSGECGICDDFEQEEREA